MSFHKLYFQTRKVKLEITVTLVGGIKLSPHTTPHRRSTDQETIIKVWSFSGLTKTPLCLNKAKV